MAFFDKLNDLAKSVKDAANDAVETTRIKSRISSEKRAVDEACRKIGEYYYAKRAGDMGPVDDDILEYCIEIDEHMRVISELEAELERHRAWSLANGLMATPHVLVDGRSLPPPYRGEDLATLT